MDFYNFFCFGYGCFTCLLFYVCAKNNGEINEISPEYLGNLTAENIGTREADAAIQNYTKSILLNAKAKRLAAQIDEIEQKKQEKRNKLDSGEYYNWYDPWVAVWNSAAEKLDRTTNAIGSFVTHGNLKGWDETSATPENGYYTDVASMSIARYREEVKKLDEQQAMLNKTLEETTKGLMAVSSASDKDEKPDPYAGGGGSTTSHGDKKDDPYKTDLKALEENQKQALYTLRLNHEKGLMVETLRALYERNEGENFSVVLCNIFRDLQLRKIKIGRKKRKKFIGGYARVASKFSIIAPSYGGKLQRAAQRLYRTVEALEATDLFENEDDIACAIYLLSGLQELGRDVAQIAEAFDANQTRVELLLMCMGDANEKA